MTRPLVMLASLLVAAACGREAETPPPTPRPAATTARPAAPPDPEPATTTTPTATTTLPAAAEPLRTPDDARRLLEEHGIDPEELSRQVGEIMRERFKNTWTTSTTVR